MKQVEELPFLARMEIDTQERQEKEMMIQKIAQLEFKKITKKNNCKKGERKTMAEIAVKKLYQDAFVYKDRKDKKRNRLQDKIKKKIDKKKTTVVSEKLFKTRQNEQIDALFKLLDSDRDGLVSLTRMNLNICKRKLNILMK